MLLLYLLVLAIPRQILSCEAVQPECRLPTYIFGHSSDYLHWHLCSLGIVCLSSLCPSFHPSFSCKLCRIDLQFNQNRGNASQYLTWKLILSLIHFQHLNEVFYSCKVRIALFSSNSNRPGYMQQISCRFRVIARAVTLHVGLIFHHPTVLNIRKFCKRNMVCTELPAEEQI